MSYDDGKMCKKIFGNPISHLNALETNNKIVYFSKIYVPVIFSPNFLAVALKLQRIETEDT